MAEFFVGVTAIMIVFLFGSVGEIITEKSGHLNLGTPGIMCMGGAGAMIGTAITIAASGGTENVVNGDFPVVLGVIFPMIFGLLLAVITGLLYCFVVDTLRCNQNITGLIITTLGAGLYQFIGTALYPSDDLERYAYTEIARRCFKSYLPDAFVKANWFTEILFDHGFLFYIAIACAIVAFFIIRNTRIGLSLRAVGESPSTSDASGVNVNKYKYVATLIGSAIAGLGGIYYFLDLRNGSAEYSIEAYGWIAVALVIFSIWNTGLSLAGSFIFATLYQLVDKSNAVGWVNEIIKLTPYFFTVVVLIIVSLFKKRETQPPSALGLSYYREDR